MTEHSDINKIIIIGKAHTWIHAPMEGETWGVNDLVLNRRLKLAFEMHDIEDAIRERPEEFAKIKELGIPVVTQEKHELVPTAIPFPIDEMPVKYFTNSIAYMVAYAIHKKATSIDIYGVMCACEEEYTLQRPCIEFWIAYAMGKGIEVNVHGETKIFTHGDKEGLYGYDWNNSGRPGK